MNLSHMISHMNIPRTYDVPDYPYFRSWEERLDAKRSGAGGSGSGYGGGDEEDRE